MPEIRAAAAKSNVEADGGFFWGNLFFVDLFFGIDKNFQVGKRFARFQ
jgi:hypothetical protein